MSVCFIDTETLGLDPDYNPIWEVGLIVDDQEHCWQLRVTGRDIALANPVALEISGFNERYVAKTALPGKHVMGLLAQFSAGRHLVGAIPSFDEERLRRLMWKLRITPAWHYHIIDVEALMVGFIQGRLPIPGTTAAMYPLTSEVPVTLPWSSHALSAAVGVDSSQFEEHTALGDARWAKAVYEKIMVTR